jgi:putative chitinase
VALTEVQLRELFPRAAEGHIAAFARQNGELFARFGIDGTTVRRDFFLAQIGHESGGLHITEENLNYSAERLCAVWPSRFPNVAAAQPYARNPERLANRVYGGRMGNGPEESGDGWRYRGRGYIQITGRDGYARVGRIAGRDFVANPQEVFEPQYALLAACAFWEWKGMNAICDGGNFVSVTRRINGGTNGLDDRRAWLDKVRRTLEPPASEPAAVPPPFDPIALQRALQAAGYSEVGAADGVVGRRTRAAVTRYRHEHGMPEGGIDAALLTALGLGA